MAERVIDDLEAVEIDQQQAAGLFARRRIAEHFTENSAQGAAIGQSGQTVMRGQVSNAVNTLAFSGNVGGNALIACKDAILPHGLARQRDPARTIFHSGAHDVVGETSVPPHQLVKLPAL